MVRWPNPTSLTRLYRRLSEAMLPEAMLPGVLCLLASLILLVHAVWREPETVVVAILGKQTIALPPYQVNTDRDRLLGLVFQPLCPPPDRLDPLLDPAPTLADCSAPDPDSGAVSVVLPADLRLAGRRIEPDQAMALLHAWAARAEARGWPRYWLPPEPEPSPGAPRPDTSVSGGISLDGRHLRIVPAEGITGDQLRLALHEASLAEQDAASGCRLGTGAWREIHCLPPVKADPRSAPRTDTLAKRSPSDPAWAAVPSALRHSGLVSDISVLQRRHHGRGRSRIVIVGLDSPDPPAPTATEQSRPPPEQTTEGLTETMASAMAEALIGEQQDRLHLVRGLESAEVIRLRRRMADPALTRSTLPWNLYSRSGDRSLWLVANPALDGSTRAWLLNQVRCALNDANTFDRLSGSPAYSLLPPVHGPVRFAQRPSRRDCQTLAERTPDSEPTALQPLLTHSYWGQPARQIHTLSGLEHLLKLRITSVEQFQRQRERGNYSLSMLAVVADDSSHPSRVLADNLPIWFTPESAGTTGTRHPLVVRAQALAAKELAADSSDPATDPTRGTTHQQALAQLLADLDEYMVPISSPPRWFALRHDLTGWDSYAERLDPDRVGDRSYPLPESELWGLISAAIGLILLFGGYWIERERRQHRATLARDLAGIQHDLDAPLASIRAAADHLGQRLATRVSDGDLAERLRQTADNLNLDADAALAVIQDMQVILDPSAVLDIQRQHSCRLSAEVLIPELDRLCECARREHVALDLKSWLPEPDPMIAVGPAVVRRVVRNALDNALKFRRPGESGRITLRTEVQPDQIILSIEDQGIGFDRNLLATPDFRLRMRGDNARQAGIAGHGLGLAACQRLLRAAGGDIDVVQASDPTRIRVRLPRPSTASSDDAESSSTLRERGCPDDRNPVH